MVEYALIMIVLIAVVVVVMIVVIGHSAVSNTYSDIVDGCS